ncbi:MAG: EAL domain-containing protein, partial [Alphaproteobacteria bacterium]|nr:EAL domain-containing protein [Alphaproteobacteria bacterium]
MPKVTLGSVLVVDSHGKIVHASEGFCRMVGHPSEALVGKLPHSLRIDFPARGGSESGTFAGEIRRRDGQKLSVSLRDQAIDIHGAPARIVTVVNAVPMGAPDRPLVLDIVGADGDRAMLGAPANSIVAIARASGAQVAFLKVRLDRIQSLNQTAGYEIGDAILREVQERLRTTVRPGGMIARTATNQFTLVSPIGPPGREIDQLSAEILTSLSDPYAVGDRSYRLSASVGVAVFPVHGSGVAELVYASDLALREARQRGGNRVELFSPAFRDRLNRELALDHALSDALGRDEFNLNYQPLVDLKDGTIVSAEALLRWNHPELGQISPVEFIPRAEATGLIVPIGDWVLHRAFEEAKSWETKGQRAPKVGVNLSAVQFGQDDIVETIVDALSSCKLSPERVDIELTEHSLVDDRGFRKDAIARFRNLGMSVSIDDFGTGYSSLSQLVDSPVDTLKIDQSFIAGLIHHPQSVTIVRTIIEMAGSLDLK